MEKMVLTVQRTNKKLKTKETENRQWSDLHLDILCIIMGKLYYVDQIHFRAVCRSWRSVVDVRPADKLPWVVILDWKHDYGLYVYNLYDPSHRREYLTQFAIKPREWSGISLNIYAAKYGWLFLSGKPCHGYTNFFLCNPFTMKTIDLPSLLIFKTSEATFSTIPTSPGCVFFVVHGIWMTSQIFISTYLIGDTAWSTFTVDGYQMSRLKDVAYCKGNFYCLFLGGILGAFDIASHKWGVLTIDTSQITNSPRLQDLEYMHCINIVESDGELLLVYYRKDWKPWHIFRLDRLQMKWVKEVCLGNRALFLGYTPYSISTTGETKSLAGHIYYHHDRRSSYYYFKNISRHRNSKLRPLKSKYYPLVTEDTFSYKVWIGP